MSRANTSQDAAVSRKYGSMAEIMKVAVAVGTIPEAVKLGPVCRQLAMHGQTLCTHVVVSGQHPEGVRETLRLFGVAATSQLPSIVRHNLSVMLSSLLDGFSRAFRESPPDLVLVQGDTATTLAAALAAFYEGIAIAHVEAGLTTGDITHPFPEEFHRHAIDRLAHLLFAPSERAAVRARGVARSDAEISFTGNTVIDALLHVLSPRASDPPAPALTTRKKILVTIHRRENHGPQGRALADAVVRLAATRRDTDVIFIKHRHPGLSSLHEVLQGEYPVTVLAPQSYPQMLRLLDDCYLAITDSGGVQEEAAWLRKPTLVVREQTERSELVELGATKLVVGDPDFLYFTAMQLLDDERAYDEMRLARERYPYGQGDAACRIVEHIIQWLRHAGVPGTPQIPAGSCH